MIPELEKQRFQFLCDAVHTGQLALVSCARKDQERTAYVLTVIYPREDGTHELFPVAELLHQPFDDIYERPNINLIRNSTADSEA